ncbi:MAG: cation:proton antiporter [Chloroflexota bacterium]
MHESEFVLQFTILLGAALVGGMIAHRLKQPVILGYLIVGIIIGPYAAGFVNDMVVVEAGATIGVALLMFTLGLEVSLSQLKQVGKVGLWGGFLQILLTFALGMLAAILVFDWSLRAAALFGLAISLSSTMVCLKLLMERGEMDSIHGRIMIAMLILQDIGVVLMLVILPMIAGEEQNLLLALGMALGKAVLFVGAAIVLGVWVLPWLMGRIGGVRTRELFLLTILVLSLGAALSTQIIGLSAVFGAFLVGLVLRETRFARRALAEISPIRDSFAALFFVSMGMLLDPSLIAQYWWIALTTVALVLSIKFLSIFTIVRSFRYGWGITLLTAAGLSQIGEFSFILAQSGLNMGIISDQNYSMIIGSAIITMLLTPLGMSLASRLYTKLTPTSMDKVAEAYWPDPGSGQDAKKPVLIAGFGRVGQMVAKSLDDAGIPYTVIEIDPELAFSLRCDGINCIYGDAGNIRVLAQADIAKARTIVVTYPDPLAVYQSVKVALCINPDIHVMARVRREQDAQDLGRLGVTDLISPEYEAGREFARRIIGA